jgi:enoyl-CoA hydratase
MTASVEDPVGLSDVTPDGLRTLFLNRPDKANALSPGLVEAIHACLDRVGSETRVLLVRGEGRNFCGGFDFAGYEQHSAGDLLLRFVRIEAVLSRLRRAPFLTIAWVSGAAFGAGADIACACAVRLGSPRARLRFPGFRFGVALGTRRLAALAGEQRARAILLGNLELDAAAAVDAGLLNEICSDADLPRRLDALLRSVADLESESLKTLLAVTEADGPAARDVADLVASLARPGLHQRIAKYRAATSRSRTGA